MSAPDTPTSELILYVTEDGRTRIQCRFEGETLWLTQAQIAELFQTTPQNITIHLRELFSEGELDPDATCKDYLQVRREGTCEVSRTLRHYNLEVVLAVGFRVRSARGAQFRRWATERLREYLLKGFVMDDERLKNPPGPGHKDYFDELLERVREIRASERRFDARFIVFGSGATNLVPGDTNAAWDIFVHDRTTHATRRVSVDSNGVQAGWNPGSPSISRDGRSIAFGDYSSSLVPGDTNGVTDIFVVPNPLAP